MTNGLIAVGAETISLPMARQIIETSDRFDLVRKARDQMEAVRKMYEMDADRLTIEENHDAVKVSREAAFEASVLKVTAERRMGRMLSSMAMNRGGRPSKTGDIVSPVSLRELGIDKKQSSRWQIIGRLPQPEFDQHIASTREAKKELTTAALLKLARRQPELTEYEADEFDPNVVSDFALLAGQQFGTVYADPPWRYGNQGTRASTDNHYDTMTVDEICELPVSSVVSDSAHLHLWTTNAFLFEAKRVMDAWGFEYKSCFIWVKPQMGIGNYWRVSHEFMLFGIRGKCPFGSRSEKSWRELKRGEHSAKPEEIRGIVERVSPGPRLEMFGRQAVPGWTVFGNQVKREFQRTL